MDLRFGQAKGQGYAINTSEELKFVADIAAATGVVLDPVYRFVSIICLAFCSATPDVSVCHSSDCLFLLVGKLRIDCRRT